MNTLIKFKNFVEEINTDNSRNYKLSILEKYKDDEDIKFYLNFVFNTYIKTGISEKKLNKISESINNCKDISKLDSAYIETNIKEYLSYFYIPNEAGKISNTGTDYDIAFAQLMLEKCSDDIEPLLYALITKNLNLGIDVKSINKVITNLIPTFNVMLANKYFQKPEVVEGKLFAITTKIDGMRCIMLKENGNVTFWSRQGQPIEGLVDLEEEAKYLPDGIALDGELVAISDNPDTYKMTMKLARTKDIEKHGLKMKVFDYMTAEGFRNQNYKDHYLGRRADIIEMFSRLFREEAIKRGKEFAETHPNHIGYVWRNDQIELINTKYTYFEILPILYEGSDTSKIVELLEEQTSKGEEGVMINICDAAYEFKRSNVLLKVKRFSDVDLKVIGYQEGTNKNANRLGALICDYKGNELYVGGGYSDEDRDEIWAHRDEWIGKVITVKYFEETQNANGGLSLRFPTYVGERIDKGADY